ncbi:MRPS24 (predicted) [Pycnogonum litorale]
MWLPALYRPTLYSSHIRSLSKNICQSLKFPSLNRSNQIHTTFACCKSQAGKYKSTKNRSRALTYEQVCRPWHIAQRKTWNSWNTANLFEGLRAAETTIEDVTIRKFIYGTWHGLFLSEVIIKRRYNLIVISGIVQRSIHPRKMYFLLGYSEEMLSYLMKCPIKMEIQTTPSNTDVIHKYI